MSRVNINIFQGATRENVILIILILWSIFFIRYLPIHIKSLTIQYPLIYSLSSEEKYGLIDGAFYQFIKDCDKEIPKDSNIDFIIVPDDMSSKFMTGGWYLSEYYFSRSSYYLYPRRIYRQATLAVQDNKFAIIYDALNGVLTLNIK